MNAQNNLRMQIEDNLLRNVERVVAEKMQHGHADQVQYGFVAQLANATPPVNEAFQHALRARILTELSENTDIANVKICAKEKEKTMAIKNRVQTINFRRLSWIGGLVAMLVLILMFGALQFIHIGELEMRATAPAVPPALQLASGDVDMLVDRINADSAPRTVLVYPGAYAETLAEHIRHQVVPLLLNDHPDSMAIQAALGAALPPSGLVDVLIVKQETTETTQRVLDALERRLYRLYRPGGAVSETYGKLERNQFIVGPQDAVLEPVEAMFDGGIELVAGSIFSDPHPGEPLPMAFDWRVSGPVEDSLAMFVHLIYDENRLIAQWDAVPGSALSPMETWAPGELVRHQFALRLPSELPIGNYEIQVGIYSTTSGQRYTLVEPVGNTYDVIVVQQFTIKE